MVHPERDEGPISLCSRGLDDSSRDIPNWHVNCNLSVMRGTTRLVIADDLTGANDTGVHFLGADHPVTVIVDGGVQRDTPAETTSAGQKAPTDVPTAETVVVNTDTRFSDATTAYSIVSDNIARYCGNGSREICKKVDSTLRGNIGAEIDACLDTGFYDIACVAPATPRNGRTVLDGRCYVHGIPLHETEIATDRFTPVDESDIRRIIRRQSSRTSVLLPLSVLRGAGTAAERFVTDAIRRGVEIIVCDAETVEDLRNTRALFSSLDERVLYVGSAGLFHARDEIDHEEPARAVSIDPETVTSALFVIGSLMQTTQGQVEHLIAHTDTGYCRVGIDDGVPPQGREIDDLAGTVRDQLAHHDAVVIQTAYPDREITADGSTIAAALGAIVDRVVAERKVDLIVATGGDTALHVLKQMNVHRLDLVGEVLPGVALARFDRHHPSAGTLFATKAGSYGDPDALTYLFHHLISGTRPGVHR